VFENTVTATIHPPTTPTARPLSIISPTASQHQPTDRLVRRQPPAESVPSTPLLPVDTEPKSSKPTENRYQATTSTSATTATAEILSAGPPLRRFVSSEIVVEDDEDTQRVVDQTDFRLSKDISGLVPPVLSASHDNSLANTSSDEEDPG
jgi:hypothetical protein